MRIIAGQWRGHRLAALGKGDDAARLRPTPDRVRESLFSMLASRGIIEGARVLDLFAGTGALGLEALSRGAETATFVEQGRTGLRLIADNIAKLDAGTRARVLRGDATRLPRHADAGFDMVFLDPPYGKSLGQKALLSAVQNGWLATGAWVVWEEASAQSAPTGFEKVEDRTFGGTSVTLLQVSA